jgi:hypothetical protein
LNSSRKKEKLMNPSAQAQGTGPWTWSWAVGETRKNLSLAATGRVLTEADKDKISEARKGITLSAETRSKISAAAVVHRGVTVKVKNMNTNVEVEFASLTDASKNIGVSRPAVKEYSDTGKLIQGIYFVTTK